MYNMIYNDRDPIDAVAFRIYIYNKKWQQLVLKKYKYLRTRCSLRKDKVNDSKEKNVYKTTSELQRHLFQFLYKSDDNQTELFMTQLTREFPEHITLW